MGTTERVHLIELSTASLRPVQALSTSKPTTMYLNGGNGTWMVSLCLVIQSSDAFSFVVHGLCWGMSFMPDTMPCFIYLELDRSRTVRMALMQ